MNYFITGTDTDAGKTIATALLLSGFAKHGTTAVMKPLQTGCENEGDVPDLDTCTRLTGIQPIDRALQAPCCFTPACSPHFAANQAGTEIELAPIVDAARQLEQKTEHLLAEGAGGLFVPINERETMLDLIQQLDYPVILVVQNKLGAINHALLSIAALRQAGCTLAGVIMTHPINAPLTDIQQDNERIIAKLGKTRILASVPYLSSVHKNDPIAFKTETEPINTELYRALSAYF